MVLRVAEALQGWALVQYDGRHKAEWNLLVNMSMRTVYAVAYAWLSLLSIADDVIFKRFQTESRFARNLPPKFDRTPLPSTATPLSLTSMCVYVSVGL